MFNYLHQWKETVILSPNCLKRTLWDLQPTDTKHICDTIRCLDVVNALTLFRLQVIFFQDPSPSDEYQTGKDFLQIKINACITVLLQGSLYKVFVLLFVRKFPCIELYDRLFVRSPCIKMVLPFVRKVSLYKACFTVR